MASVDEAERRLEIRGRLDTKDGRPAVTIRVEDRGIGLEPEELDGSSSRSTRPSRTAWGSASRSAARSSRPTAGACGPKPTRGRAPRSRSRFPPLRLSSRFQRQRSGARADGMTRRADLPTPSPHISRCRPITASETALHATLAAIERWHMSCFVKPPRNLKHPHDGEHMSKKISLAKRSEKGLLTPDNCVVALIDSSPASRCCSASRNFDRQTDHQQQRRAREGGARVRRARLSSRRSRPRPSAATLAADAGRLSGPDADRALDR